MSERRYVLKFEPKDLHYQVWMFDEATDEASIMKRFVNREQAIEYFEKNYNIELIDSDE